VKDILETAHNEFVADVAHWSEIYEKAEEDLVFLSDEPGAQWEPKGWRARKDAGRPALTVDQLNQFVHQVANDERQNTPTIDVVPAEDADIEDAKLIKEWIRGIEYRSSADAVYDAVGLDAIKCSFGFMRVDHEYASREGFEQELCIKYINNQFACYIDRNSVESDGRDAKHAFVLEQISVKEFERKYPEKTAISFETDIKSIPLSEGDIQLCTFYMIDDEPRTIKDGGKSRTISEKIVRCYKLSGQDVLEESVFPGEYIPIVPVYGEECWIKGKRHLKSLIRMAKEGQMMFNLWKSLEAELLMKQPQAPLMAAEGQLAGYEDGFIDPTKLAVLTYRQTDVDGNQAPAPQRLAAPQIPTGIVNAARESVDDIKATMGLYNASIGQRSNETSGIAIARRQEEGNTATYHFPDNRTRSITQVGRILISARKVIYDSARIVRGMDNEGNPTQIGINGIRADKQERDIDFTKGDYDVRVTTGSNSITRREDAAALLGEVIKGNPAMLQTVGDLWAKNLDIAGADALAERLRKVIPAQLLEGEDGQEVDIEKQQMQVALQQMQQQLQQAQVMLEDKKAGEQIKMQVEQSKLQLDASKLQIEQEKVANDRLKIEMDAQLRAAELQKPAAQPSTNKLPDGLQVTKTPEALAMEDSHHADNMSMEQQKLVMEADKLMLEQQKIASEQQEAQQRAAQAQMMTQVLVEIKSTLDKMAQPKSVVYDPNGVIVGVK
jgi:hypothetical protein